MSTIAAIGVPDLPDCPRWVPRNRHESCSGGLIVAKPKRPDAAQPTAGAVAPTGFFVFRTPLLPYEELLGLSADLKGRAARHDPAALEQTLADDRRAIRERLRALCTRPEVVEALFVASPSLEESLGHWLASPE